MKSKFATIIMSIIIIIIIGVIGIFGIIVLQEFYQIDIYDEVENFVTDFSTINNEDNLTQKIEAPQIIQEQLDGVESTLNNIKNVDYTNIKVNKHFYNQLSEESKILYKAFESNRENMKTGTYKIEFGTAFTTLLSKKNGQDLLWDYYQSAIEAYTHDNPDVFYLDAQKMYLNVETITKGSNVTYNAYINSGNEQNYLVNEFNTKEKVDNAIAKLENIRSVVIQNKQQTTYDNIKMVHDYLVQTIEYESTISKNNIYNIYGALINKECVCEGYAKSFKYLMDGLNIPCLVVSGKVTDSQGKMENHAWNYVEINGMWYAVDTTWDDPVIIGNGKISNTRKYKYFLVGEEKINVDHIPEGKFTEKGKEFLYPELSKESHIK